jgi:hypothetical protein
MGAAFKAAADTAQLKQLTAQLSVLQNEQKSLNAELAKMRSASGAAASATAALKAETGKLALQIELNVNPMLAILRLPPFVHASTPRVTKTRTRFNHILYAVTVGIVGMNITRVTCETRRRHHLIIVHK